MPTDAAPTLFRRPLSEEELRAARRGVDLEGQATAQERAAIAKSHDLPELRMLGYTARLEPYGREGWRLEGRLLADFDQSCVISLQPAPGRLDEPFERLWSPDAPEDGAAEDPAAPDEDPDAPLLERTPDPIDPAAAALETFTLSLDPYPRAPGVSFDGATHGPPDAEPLTEEAAKPFAGLSALRDSLAAQAASVEEVASEKKDGASKGEDDASGGENA